MGRFQNATGEEDSCKRDTNRDSNRFYIVIGRGILPYETNLGELDLMQTLLADMKGIIYVYFGHTRTNSVLLII